MNSKNQGCFKDCFQCQKNQQSYPKIFRFQKQKKCLNITKRKRHLVANQTKLNQKNKLNHTLPNGFEQNKQLISPIFLERKSFINIRYTNPSLIQNQIAHHIFYPQQQNAQKSKSLQTKCDISKSPYLNFLKQSQTNSSQKKTYSIQGQRISCFSPSKNVDDSLLLKSKTKRMKTVQFSPIIEVEQAKQKRLSSLYQGAKSIISKLKSSNKKQDQEQGQSLKVINGQSTPQVYSNIFRDAKFCETKSVINFSYPNSNCQKYHNPVETSIFPDLKINFQPKIK